MGACLCTSPTAQAQTDDFLWAVQAGGIGFDKGSRVAVDPDGHIVVTGYFQETATFGNLSLTSTGFKDIFVAKYDGEGQVLWAVQGEGDFEDEGLGIATDASGNILVTGAFFEEATFGTTTLTGRGSFDVFVVKYDADGNVLWAASGGGTSLDRGFGIAADAAGNCAVTGQFSETATFGNTTLVSDGIFDIFVASYAADGTFRWAKKAGGQFTDEGNDIVLDPSGNTLVTGKFSGAVTFGDTTLFSNRLFNTFLAKYDTAGNLRWVRKAGGRDDFGYGIATDAMGNALLTGYFQQAGRFEGIQNGITLNSAGSGDIYIAKYDSTGELRWAVQAGGPDLDQGFGIGTDAAGNAVVTGFFVGTATFGDTTLTSIAKDAFVAKYDSGGTFLWATQVGGAGTDEGYDVAVNEAGQTVLTGLFEGTTAFGDLERTSAGEQDLFLAKLGPEQTTGTHTAWDQVEGFRLSQNYPNPFNPGTRIDYQAPTGGQVTLAVYSLLGRKVRTLVDQYRGAGHHTVFWDGRNDAGQPVAGGTYVYRLTAGRLVQAKQLLLLR